MDTIEQLIQKRAYELGYEKCGIIPISLMDEYGEKFEERMEKIPKSKMFYQSQQRLVNPKEIYPWAKSVVVLTVPYMKYKVPEILNGVKDACEAFKRFFKGLADKPKFKSRRKSKPSFYNDTSKLKVKFNIVLIEKVGLIKTAEQIPMNVKYTNPRISFDGEYWYISVGIETEQPVVELTDESIGIDVGVKELAICSNGMTFKNINKTKKVKKLEKRLRRLQRKISKKYELNKEGRKFVKTSNIIKLEKQIRLLHRKLANIRSNNSHQATNKIVKTKPSRVVMETLNIKGMMKNKHLSKAIAQQGLYEFKRQLQYKCEFYGIKFIEADKWYPSSKTCSECGHVKPKLSLFERTYICEECGCVIDRDYNASINLSRYELVV